MADAAAFPDRDLDSIREARELARRARAAQTRLADLSQEQIDAIVDAVAAAAQGEVEAFARLAVDETGYGNEADKIKKNRFAAETIYNFIQPMRTVGVINRRESERIIEIAEPFGVVAAIVPSTNPTSTAIYKILVCLKARCAVVLSPHPSAARSIIRVADVLTRAALSAGAPEGAVNCMTTITQEGTQELMQSREVALILATGGLGLVRAAYSAGKPAYGVGPGNAPAYIEGTADIPKAVADIITGKTFDNGVLCSSENSVVVDEAVAGDVRRIFEEQGGRFLDPREAAKLAEVLVTPQRLPNPELVGKSAIEIAARVGIEVTGDTRVLIAPLTGVGRGHPLSMEKLCPVLSFYEVSDWRAACARCKEILAYGGMGHTMSIHSGDERIILEFGLQKPAFRIVVNSPTTLGAIGMTTGLDPSMTLGCGGWGGNITSDNITPRHLLNVKRLAYETRSAPRPSATVVGGPAAPLPQAPDRPVSRGVDPAVLSERIESFLASRGIASTTAAPPADQGPTLPPAAPPTPPTSAAPFPPPATPMDFVCEDDVRQALRENRQILVSAETIITPAARDLGEAQRVFVHASLPR